MLPLVLFGIFDIKKGIEGSKLALKVFYQIAMSQKYGRILPTIIKTMDENTRWTQNKAGWCFRSQIHGDLHAYSWTNRGH